MNLIAELKFITTFALKPSNVTHMSGRTLLLPTPYAIKMALTDRAIVRYGYEKSKEIFPAIRDLNISWSGPSVIGVTQITERGYRLGKSSTKEQVKIQEYCTYSGSFYLAFENYEQHIQDDLVQFITMLFHLGRSSSVVNCEFLYVEVVVANQQWLNLGVPVDYAQAPRGIVQRMDDMKDNITLDDVSTYKFESRAQTRLQYDIVIPYKMAHASRNFVGYERIYS